MTINGKLSSTQENNSMMMMQMMMQHHDKNRCLICYKLLKTWKNTKLCNSYNLYKKLNLNEIYAAAASSTTTATPINDLHKCSSSSLYNHSTGSSISSSSNNSQFTTTPKSSLTSLADQQQQQQAQTLTIYDLLEKILNLNYNTIKHTSNLTTPSTTQTPIVKSSYKICESCYHNLRFIYILMFNLKKLKCNLEQTYKKTCKLLFVRKRHTATASHLTATATTTKKPQNQSTILKLKNNIFNNSKKIEKLKFNLSHVNQDYVDNDGIGGGGGDSGGDVVVNGSGGMEEEQPHDLSMNKTAPLLINNVDVNGSSRRKRKSTPKQFSTNDLKRRPTIATTSTATQLNHDEYHDNGVDRDIINDDVDIEQHYRHKRLKLSHQSSIINDDVDHQEQQQQQQNDEIIYNDVDNEEDDTNGDLCINDSEPYDESQTHEDDDIVTIDKLTDNQASSNGLLLNLKQQQHQRAFNNNNNHHHKSTLINNLNSLLPPPAPSPSVLQTATHQLMQNGLNTTLHAMEHILNGFNVLRNLKRKSHIPLPHFKPNRQLILIHLKDQENNQQQQQQHMLLQQQFNHHHHQQQQQQRPTLHQTTKKQQMTNNNKGLNIQIPNGLTLKQQQQQHRFNSTTPTAPTMLKLNKKSNLNSNSNSNSLLTSPSLVVHPETSNMLMVDQLQNTIVANGLITPPLLSLQQSTGGSSSSSSNSSTTSSTAIKDQQQYDLLKNTCQICDKSFKTQNILRQHLRIHTGDKPFVCTICTKAFSQMASLKYHLATHSDDRPFCCEFCSKTFKLKPPFKKHVRECRMKYTADNNNNTLTSNNTDNYSLIGATTATMNTTNNDDDEELDYDEEQDVDDEYN